MRIMPSARRPGRKPLRSNLRHNSPQNLWFCLLLWFFTKYLFLSAETGKMSGVRDYFVFLDNRSRILRFAHLLNSFSRSRPPFLSLLLDGFWSLITLATILYVLPNPIPSFSFGVKQRFHAMVVIAHSLARYRQGAWLYFFAFNIARSKASTWLANSLLCFKSHIVLVGC